MTAPARSRGTARLTCATCGDQPHTWRRALPRTDWTTRGGWAWFCDCCHDQHRPTTDPPEFRIPQSEEDA